MLVEACEALIWDKMVVEERCNSSSNGVNGFLNGSSSASDGGGNGSLGIRTYKRRKREFCSLNCDLGEFEKAPCMSSSQSEDKMVKEPVDKALPRSPCKQASVPKINFHSVVNGSDDCSYQHWRSVLENMSRSLSPTEGGVGGISSSIRDALSIPHTIDTNFGKASVDCHDDPSHSQRNCIANRSSTAARGLSAVASNGSSSESGHPTVSRACERVFCGLLMSGKFASLCKLLSENFQGLKVEKLLDFSLVNTRIKGGVYEHTPMLFSSDIQQVWRRLHSIGNEMIALANNLSELSRVFCHEMGGATEPEASSDRKHEDPNLKWEEPGSSIFCTCKHCGEKSDGRDCLVCDSCEAMFHVSCIQPVVKEIPCKSWYCANCTASGIESPHEDCAVCDRLNSHSGVNGLADAIPTYEDALDDDPESSDGIIETGVQVFRGSKRLNCKVCRCTLSNGDEFRVCEHKYCQYKCYHTRCLSNKELRSYGPRWYCPSCLCRVCLTDKDDDDLVMCDGCDHGYHIYCMNPPRTSIPRGKWFCPKCDAGIKAIRKVKMLYEGLEKEQKKSEGEGVAVISSKKSKLDFEATASGSGGMDMLLTAARTLKEEELAALDEN